MNVDICFDAEEADRLNLSLFLVEDILNSDLIDSEYTGFGIAVQRINNERCLFCIG